MVMTTLNTSAAPDAISDSTSPSGRFTSACLHAQCGAMGKEDKGIIGRYFSYQH